MQQSTIPHISVVVPVYRSGTVLEELFQRSAATLASITDNFEFIFVNDASPDSAWEVIKNLAQRDPRIRGINLSRNFGQYPAITAGLSVSRGEWIVVMDCDLQDQPEAIENMYRKAQEGFLVVVGSRQKRHDNVIRQLVSRAFYSTLSYLTGRHHNRRLTNFGMYHRKVIDAVLSLNDRMRYFSVMVRWVGFPTTTVPVEHAPRRGGRSSYSLRKLFTLATDIILAYSDKPLRLIVKIGLITSLLSGGYFIVMVGKLLFDVSLVSAFEVLLTSLWFIFGLITVMLGIIALYLGKTFDETKHRPLYIVQEEI